MRYILEIWRNEKVQLKVILDGPLLMPIRRGDTIEGRLVMKIRHSFEANFHRVIVELE